MCILIQANAAAALTRLTASPPLGRLGRVREFPSSPCCPRNRCAGHAVPIARQSRANRAPIAHRSRPSPPSRPTRMGPPGSGRTGGSYAILEIKFDSGSAWAGAGPGRKRRCHGNAHGKYRNAHGQYGTAHGTRETKQATAVTITHGEITAADSARGTHMRTAYIGTRVIMVARAHAHACTCICALSSGAFTCVAQGHMSLMDANPPQVHQPRWGCHRSAEGLQSLRSRWKRLAP